MSQYKKIISYIVILLFTTSIIIEGLLLFPSTTLCQANMEKEETCCCDSGCSSSEKATQHTKAEISNDCECSIAALATVPKQNILVVSHSFSIAKIIHTSIDEISIPNQLNRTKPPEQISHNIKDICLFNSILRI